MQRLTKQAKQRGQIPSVDYSWPLIDSYASFKALHVHSSCCESPQFQIPKIKQGYREMERERMSSRAIMVVEPNNNQNTTRRGREEQGCIETNLSSSEHLVLFFACFLLLQMLIPLASDCFLSRHPPGILAYLGREILLVAYGNQKDVPIFFFSLHLAWMIAVLRDVIRDCGIADALGRHIPVSLSLPSLDSSLFL